MTDEVADDRRY